MIYLNLDKISSFEVFLTKNSNFVNFTLYFSKGFYK